MELGGFFPSDVAPDERAFRPTAACGQFVQNVILVLFEGFFEYHSGDFVNAYTPKPTASPPSLGEGPFYRATKSWAVD